MKKKITTPLWLPMVATILTAIISGFFAWHTATRADEKKHELAAQRKLVDYSKQIELVDKFSNGFDWLVPHYSYLDSISDGYAIIFIPNKEEYISGKICDAIGYERSELGKTIADIKKYVNPQDFALFAQHCGAIIDNKGGTFQGIKRIKTRWGGEIAYNVRVTKEGPYLISLFNRVSERMDIAAK